MSITGTVKLSGRHNDYAMANSMRRWGAIDTECPECHKLTPVYPTEVKGGNKSVTCLYCGVSLQWDDGRAVLAVHGLLNNEEQQCLEEREKAIVAEVYSRERKALSWWERLYNWFFAV